MQVQKTLDIRKNNMEKKNFSLCLKKNLKS